MPSLLSSVERCKATLEPSGWKLLSDTKNWVHRLALSSPSSSVLPSLLPSYRPSSVFVLLSAYFLLPLDHFLLLVHNLILHRANTASRDPTLIYLKFPHPYITQSFRISQFKTPKAGNNNQLHLGGAVYARPSCVRSLASLWTGCPCLFLSVVPRSV